MTLDRYSFVGTILIDKLSTMLFQLQEPILNRYTSKQLKAPPHEIKLSKEKNQLLNILIRSLSAFPVQDLTLLKMCLC